MHSFEFGINKTLYILKALADNYIYVLTNKESAIVIDPGETSVVFSLLKEKNLQLKAIFLTHFHEDHIAGAKDLKEKTGCKVFAADDKRIKIADSYISNEKEFTVEGLTFVPLQTPGHTKEHLVFFEKEHKLLFSGDLLFSLGCGRLFEGTPQQMYTSLAKLNILPEDTKVFPGHEYTLQNARFAKSIESSEKIDAKIDQVEKNLSKNGIAIPSTLKEERMLNPFLRVDDPSFKARVGKNISAIEAFAKLRSLKDQF